MTSFTSDAMIFLFFPVSIPCRSTPKQNSFICFLCSSLIYFLCCPSILYALTDVFFCIKLNIETWLQMFMSQLTCKMFDFRVFNWLTGSIRIALVFIQLIRWRILVMVKFIVI